MSRFVYYNRNPQHKRKENDCVCRAISLALDLDYYEVLHKLKLTSELYDCDRYLLCCYKTLIQDVFKCRSIQCENITVGEFADRHKYGTFIVRTVGHLTCVIDGTVYDIFDCRNETATDAWQV